MTHEQAQEILRLAGVWGTRKVRKYAATLDTTESNETVEGTTRSERKAYTELCEYLATLED